jgi:hypothetical protein
MQTPTINRMPMANARRRVTELCREGTEAV